MNTKLKVTEKEFSIIKKILESYPDALIFGSRVKGTSKQFSDLDVCIKRAIKDYEHELLKEAFEKSDLPFKVDIILYHQVADSFKEIIDRDGVKFSDLI